MLIHVQALREDGRYVTTDAESADLFLVPALFYCARGNEQNFTGTQLPLSDTADLDNLLRAVVVCRRGALAHATPPAGLEGVFSIQQSCA